MPSINSKIALKLLVGVASAVVSVTASALTERALTKALDHDEETDLDIVEEDTNEPEEETQEEEK